MRREVWLFVCGALIALAAALPAFAEQAQPASPAAAECRAQTSRQLRALDDLRDRLLSRIGYAAYVRRVKAVRPVVARMPVDRMTAPCLEEAGKLTEEAFNEYVYALLPWTECVADPKCDLAAVEPVVKRKWWVAGLIVSRAHAAA